MVVKSRIEDESTEEDIARRTRNSNAEFLRLMGGQESPQAGTEAVSDEATLLSAKDKAINAMSELAEEFRKLGVYHYEEMVRGQQQAIRGAVITVNDVLSKST